MNIIFLDETVFLIVSCMYTAYLNSRTIYSGHAARFSSLTIFINRLIKENLFFKENNESKPKFKFHVYYFIFTMSCDIVVNIIFIFFIKYGISVRFMLWYTISKLFIFFLPTIYYHKLNSRYREKEKESKEFKKEARKKIEATNPNFFLQSYDVLRMCCPEEEFPELYNPRAEWKWKWKWK